jgi:hypothetical protein
MATTIHRSTPEPADPEFAALHAAGDHDEITSQLASRIGELYAAEELHQRRERTERFIERAAVFAEE